MRLSGDKLAAHLAGTLAPIYLISGDEPLQHGECCDAVRAAATRAGFTTRTVMDVGSGFDWQQLNAEAAAFSLFAEKKVIDLRIPGGKPGSEGSKALLAYCENPPTDTLLLVSLPKLDRQQQQAKWFQALETAGVVVSVWPIEARRLPMWIEQRLRAAGILPTGEAVSLLAERTEGNLLAARQEIEKLLLLHGPGPLDATQLTAAVTDSARFDVFELVDSTLRGEAERCLHILDGLRSEGTATPVVLWALHREVHSLAQITADTARGVAIDTALQRARVFSSRSNLVRQALGRLRTAQWLALLDRCHLIDAAIKGQHRTDPWLLLEQLVLVVCGQRPPEGLTAAR
ncbi:MAG: DNA polymerase III subunit delta [Gammaproteobacteria bacterium]|nr:DNA polymerase III subunit delta [Gammaproteobacteria bacterium]